MSPATKVLWITQFEKVCLQASAENGKWWRRCDVLRKTVPDPNGSDWKSSVAVGWESSMGNRQLVRRSGTQTPSKLWLCWEGDPHVQIKVDVDMLIEINWRFASYCHLWNIQDGLTFDVHWAVLSRKLAIKMSFVLVVILYVCCSYSRVWTSNLPRVDTLWFWRAQVLATTSAPLHPEICRRPFCVLWRPEAIQTFQLLQFFHNLISFQGCLPRVCVTYCFADVMFVRFIEL